MKVGLLIDAETRAKQAQGTYGTSTLVYPIGEALEEIASPTLSSVFSGVDKVNATHPLPPRLDGAIQILVDEAFFTIPFPINPLHDRVASSTILLKCLVYDKEGKAIATLVSRGYARVSIRVSPWGGHIPSILKPLLGPTADRALQRAMRELVRKLIEDKKTKLLGSLAG